MSKLDELKDEAIGMLDSDDDLFVDIINELDGYDGFADGWRGYPMYELDDLFGDMSLRDFLEKITSDFDVRDDYFIDTIYGLDSTDDLAGYYRDHTTSDEVLDNVLNAPNIHIGNSEFSDLIYDIENYDEDEESENESVTRSVVGKLLEGRNIRNTIDRGYRRVSEGSTILRDNDIAGQDDVSELVLYIVNDGDLYRRQTTSIINNLKKKFKKGTYDPELAVKAYQYLADAGVRKYDKEFVSGKGELFLDKKTREEIARELRDHYQEEVEYDG